MTYNDSYVWSDPATVKVWPLTEILYWPTYENQALSFVALKQHHAWLITN